MPIFTCNFSRQKLLPAEVRPVSIARYPPRFWKGEREYRLAPPADLLRKIKADEITWDQYAKAYNAQLAKLDAAAIAADLEGAALLCFCALGEDCHRRLVAAWLEAELGITVAEYEP